MDPSRRHVLPPVAVFGETLVDVFPDRAVLGGAPFNVAYHLAHFGLDPLLVTRIGDDSEGDRLFDTIAGARLATNGVQRDAEHGTGLVRVHLDDGDPRFDIVPDRAFDFIDAGEVATALAAAPAVGLVYFGTLAQRGPASRAALETLLDATGKAGAARWLDVNLRAPWYDADIVRWSLDAADDVKVNDAELAEIVTLLGAEARGDEDRARALIDRFGLRSVTVTCGAGGAWRVAAEGRTVRAAGRPLDGSLVDTVGAGDGFAAVSIVGLLRAWPAEVILERADAFARSLCTIRGALPEDSRWYRAFLESWSDGE